MMQARRSDGLEYTARRESDDTDAQLLERASAGNAGAFRALVARHGDRVFGLALRLVGERGLAEEITQDVFMRLHAARGMIEITHTLGGWLRTVTVNRCRDHWRSAAARRAQSGLDAVRGERLVAETPGPERQLQIREALGLVEEALLGLAEEQRLAVVLRYVWGCSYGEIADSLGCSPGTVGSRLHRGLRALAAQIEARKGR